MGRTSEPAPATTAASAGELERSPRDYDAVATAHGTYNVDRGEHAVTSKALDKSGRERCRDDRGNDPNGAEDSDGERAARVVGDDEQDDEKGPVGRRTGRPGDLYPPNRAVPEHLPHCRYGRRGPGLAR